MSSEFLNAGGIAKPAQPNGKGAMLLSASSLIGNKVCNRQAEELGDIKDLMMNTVSGGVCYAVVAAGGFLGIGEKLFAVPWTALTLDTAQKRFVLDVKVDRFKDAPGFDKDKWPNMADETWAKGLGAFYGAPGAQVIGQKAIV
jgi:sporulation protein YlmC with PRC-barrel domain